MTQSQPERADEVLRFWFDGPDGGSAGHERREWFAKDAQFDAGIARRFGSLIEQALAGECAHWRGAPRSACALVVVLDQFTRNVFRGTPRMFEGDPAALGTAKQIVAQGWDRDFDVLHRWFCYMPFQHSESLEDQRESLRLFGAMRDDPVGASAWRFVQSHHDIVERFGRFPHRNAILGRPSSAAEIAFLREPGSSF